VLAHAASATKKTSYDDCLRRPHRNKRYSDGREEVDVMWAGLRLVEVRRSRVRAQVTKSMADANVTELRPAPSPFAGEGHALHPQPTRAQYSSHDLQAAERIRSFPW
jgi:hypothetical protein